MLLSDEGTEFAAVTPNQVQPANYVAWLESTLGKAAGDVTAAEVSNVFQWFDFSYAEALFLLCSIRCQSTQRNTTARWTVRGGPSLISVEILLSVSELL